MARKPRNLELKKKIVIFCEGYTEVHYFKMLKRKYRGTNVTIDPYKSKKTDAIGVVQTAISSPYSKDADIVYAIFDKDANSPSQLTTAITNANANNIKIGYSNSSFDLWILMHFENVKSSKSQPTIYKALNRYLGCSDYERDMKNNELIGEKLSDLINTATDYSNNNHLLNQSGNILNYINQNPYHNIHILIEEIFNISTFKQRYK